ncbi:hypothetical protein ACH4N4_16085 [Streptomyces microflavus]|uniref:hypothetical protein n=1 Tax=Streptomyces microflavus TaxID=1919 RepID=UPI003787C3C4
MGGPAEPVVEGLGVGRGQLLRIQRLRAAERFTRDLAQPAPGEVDRHAHEQMTTRVGVRPTRPPPLLQEFGTDGKVFGRGVYAAPQRRSPQAGIFVLGFQAPLLLLAPLPRQLDRFGPTEHPGADPHTEAVGVVRLVAHRGEHGHAQPDEVREDGRGEPALSQMAFQVVQPQDASLLAPPP